MTLEILHGLKSTLTEKHTCMMQAHLGRSNRSTVLQCIQWQMLHSMFGVVCIDLSTARSMPISISRMVLTTPSCKLTPGIKPYARCQHADVRRAPALALLTARPLTDVLLPSVAFPDSELPGAAGALHRAEPHRQFCGSGWGSGCARVHIPKDLESQT